MARQIRIPPFPPALKKHEAGIGIYTTRHRYDCVALSHGFLFIRLGFPEGFTIGILRSYHI